jgi:GGDEF domain-containing protein
MEHDPVSGLLNRQGLALAIAALPRLPSRGADWYELIVVELRSIPDVRRTFGQAVAERLTIAASERLRAAVGDADMIGQLSESHLVVLRPEPGDNGGLGSAYRVLTSLS